MTSASFTAFEQRWINAIFPVFFSHSQTPEDSRDSPAILTLEPTEVAWVTAAEKISRASCFKARFGLHAGLWIVSLAPLVVLRRPVLFSSLDTADRDRVLSAVLQSPYLAIRGLATFLKLTVSMAAFGVASVRLRSNFDRTRTWPAQTPTVNPQRKVLPLTSEVV